MSTVLKALAFLRVTDETGRLSLTHLVIFTVLGLLVAGRSVPMSELGALVVAMLSYGHKKVLAAQADARDAEAVKADHVQALEAHKAETAAKLAAVAEKVEGVAEKIRNAGNLSALGRRT